MVREREVAHQENHPQATASRDGAARRQHHLRNGAARRISATLRPLAALRRLGPGGGRSLAGLAPIKPRSPARSLLTSGNGDRALFESRVRLKQRHRRRDEHRDALLARDPGVDDIRPLLHHMAALHFVLRLVVDAARRTAVLVRKALLDPVAVETQLIEQRGSRPSEIVNREWLKRQTFLLRLLDNRSR